MVRFIFISIFFFKLPFNFYNSFEIIPITSKAVQAITLHPSEATMAKIVGTKWMVLYDGFSTTIKGGVGIVLTKEANEAMAMSLKLDFLVFLFQTIWLNMRPT